MPRAVGYDWRISPRIVRSSWPIWRKIGTSMALSPKRESFLALYAPTVLIVFLVVWMAGLVGGFGLCFYAFAAQIHPQPDLAASFYFAGTALFTIGFGDYVGVTMLTRLISLVTAACGVATVAVVTAFLFSLFGAFQRRETFVVIASHAAGSPPSGIALLELYTELGLQNVVDDLFHDAQGWAAELVESHLAYPILLFFRSSHDSVSWLTSLGALLDAANLALTTTERQHQGYAHLFLKLGTHVIRDLAEYLGFELDDAVGIEEHEFRAARERLAERGVALTEGQQAWQHFQTHRRAYSGALNALARHFAVTPAQWIADRSSLLHHERHVP